MMNKTLIVKYYEYVLWYEYVHIIFLNQFNCEKLTLKCFPNDGFRNEDYDFETYHQKNQDSQNNKIIYYKYYL